MMPRRNASQIEKMRSKSQVFTFSIISASLSLAISGIYSESTFISMERTAFIMPPSKLLEIAIT